MSNIINAIPLYSFIRYCNTCKLEKKVLDCGAGGSNPPLSLFKEFGFDVYGIDNSKEQIDKSREFEYKHNVNLNISFGDMLDLPFDDKAFSFVYTYNTSVHMRKVDFVKAFSEMFRVMKIEGLCFINFLSEECDTYGRGNEVAEGEYICDEDGTRFTHYKKDEIMSIINKFELVYFEEKKIIRYIDGNEIKSGFYDLIIKKKL